MTDPDVIAALSDRQVIALTIWGEARGLSGRGRRAVGSVILNRVTADRHGRMARAVCLRPWQFSCWRREGGQRNYETVMDTARSIQNPGSVIGPILFDCLSIADDVLAGTLPDTVDEATHYVTRALLTTSPPAWALGQTPCCEVDGHCFFAGIA